MAMNKFPLQYKYGLFEVVGIEIEYMIVNKNTLNVNPISDILLTEIAGEITDCARLGKIDVSNELVKHVIELKHHNPAKIGIGLFNDFDKAHQKLQPILDEHNVILLPTAAHPWMNPLEETQYWPYGQAEIYQQYNKIFNCQGHGWSNLQSIHINLPFANEQEFIQLHQAIRHILPLLPALCASSPILNNRLTGILDTRLHYYGSNQQRVPEISGDVIPEAIFSYQDYQDIILDPMFKAIAPLDPKKYLQEDWLNSRGAIAKFDVGALEIRIIDSQECVHADLAIVILVCTILKHWIESRLFRKNTPDLQQLLVAQYKECIKNGMDTAVIDSNICSALGIAECDTVREVWRQLLVAVANKIDNTTHDVINYIILHGNLSERITSKLPNNYNATDIHNLYEIISKCHLNNKLL